MPSPPASASSPPSASAAGASVLSPAPSPTTSPATPGTRSPCIAGPHDAPRSPHSSMRSRPGTDPHPQRPSNNQPHPCPEAAASCPAPGCPAPGCPAPGCPAPGCPAPGRPARPRCPFCRPHLSRNPKRRGRHLGAPSRWATQPPPRRTRPPLRCPPRSDRDGMKITPPASRAQKARPPSGAAPPARGAHETQKKIPAGHEMAPGPTPAPPPASLGSAPPLTGSPRRYPPAPRPPPPTAHPARSRTAPRPAAP